MTWISIDIAKAKDYVGEMNIKCIEMCDIAEKYFPNYKNIQYFGYHPTEKIFYYVTNLKSWCGNSKWYKIDFYQFKDDYFLCLKRINNEVFRIDALPSKIQKGISLFPKKQMMPDNKCLQLMFDSDKDKVIIELRHLMDYLTQLHS